MDNLQIEALAKCDPLALLIAYMNGHAVVEDALQGAGRVHGNNRPPYPCARLLDGPGGSDRDLRWLIAPTYELSVYGDLDGTPGKAELRKIMYRLLGVLADIPNQDVTSHDAVITRVSSISGAGWLPEPNGQPRYVSTIQVYAHPPSILT